MHRRGAKRHACDRMNSLEEAQLGAAFVQQRRMGSPSRAKRIASAEFPQTALNASRRIARSRPQTALNDACDRMGSLEEAQLGAAFVQQRTEANGVAILGQTRRVCGAPADSVERVASFDAFSCVAAWQLGTSGCSARTRGHSSRCFVAHCALRRNFGASRLLLVASHRTCVL